MVAALDPYRFDMPTPLRANPTYSPAAYASPHGDDYQYGVPYLLGVGTLGLAVMGLVAMAVLAIVARVRAKLSADAARAALDEIAAADNASRGGDSDGVSAATREREINIVTHTTYAGVMLDFLYIFSLVPISFDFAHHLGEGQLEAHHAALLSGWLISTPFLGKIVGVLLATPLAKRVPYDQGATRTAVLRFQLGIIFSWLAFVFVACVQWPWDKTSRIATLILSRGLAGVCRASCQVLNNVMVIKWLPPSAQVSFQVTNNILKNLCVGLGPLWASAVTSLLAFWAMRGLRVVVNEAVIAAACTLSLLPFALMLYAAYTMLPTRAPPITSSGTPPELPSRGSVGSSVGSEEGWTTTDEKKRLAGAAGVASAPPEMAAEVATAAAVVASAADVAPTDASHEHSRIRIWITSLSVAIERSWMVAGLEVATSLILVREFGVQLVDNGVLIGLTFIASTPLAILLVYAKTRRLLTDTQLLIITQGGTVAFTLLLFSSLGALLDLSSNASLCLLLLADCCLYSMAYTANGVLKGLTYAHPVQRVGTVYTQINYLLLNDMGCAAFRGLAPPVARYLVQVGGRDLYATSQLLIAISSLLSVLLILPKIRSLPRLGGRPPKAE